MYDDIIHFLDISDTEYKKNRHFSMIYTDGQLLETGHWRAVERRIWAQRTVYDVHTTGWQGYNRNISGTDHQ